GYFGAVSNVWRDTTPGCGAQHPHRRNRRQRSAAAYERRVRGLPAVGRRHAGAPASDPHHRRQSLGPHDAEGPHVSGGATHREPALHTHLFVLAEPGGTLVFEVRARCDCARTPFGGPTLTPRGASHHYLQDKSFVRSSSR